MKSIVILAYGPADIMKRLTQSTCPLSRHDASLKNERKFGNFTIVLHFEDS